MTRFFEKTNFVARALTISVSIAFLSFNYSPAFAQSKSGNVDGLATKLPSKTILQMGLSAKDPRSAAKSGPANSAAKPKPRAAAKWGKQKAPVETKKTKAATATKPNKQKNSANTNTAKKPKAATIKKPTASKPAALPQPVSGALKPTKKLPAPITDVKKLNTKPEPVAKSKRLPAPVTSKTKKQSPSAKPPQLPGEVLGQIFGSNLFALTIFVGFLLIFVAILNAFAYSRLFKLAGYPGWAVWVPFYNIFVHLKIAGLPTWAVVGYLVPYIGGFMSFFAQYRFAKAYGKNQSYCMFFAVFNPIMAPILAMSKTTVYVGSAVANLANSKHGMAIGTTTNQPLAVSMMRPGAGSAALSQMTNSTAASNISKIA